MNISFNPQVFLKNINVKKTAINNLERTPSKDIVSFGAKKHTEKKLPPNVQCALEYSQDIMDKLNQGSITLDDITDITAKYAPDVVVLPIDELKNQIEDANDYAAFFSSHISDDFKTVDKKMYVPLPAENADDMQKIIFTMNCAHEFTHVQQQKNDEAFTNLKIMSKGDITYAKAIMGIGDAIWTYFDKQIQAQTVLNTIKNDIDNRKFMKYRTIPPQPARVSLQSMVSANGMSSEKEIKNAMRKKFDEFFNLAMNSLDEEQRNMIPKNESIDNLRKKVRAYCQMCAIGEVEAYKTEAEIARKALNTTETINLDANHIYYDMIAKAFS